MFEFRLRSHWSFFLISALIQIMARHRPGDKSLSERMMVRLATHSDTQLAKQNHWMNNTGWDYREQHGILTHWGRVTHIYVSKTLIIGSDNGLSPGRRQAIIWINAGILLIGLLGTNFTQILIEVYTFSFKKMHLQMSSGIWRPFCLGLNELMQEAYCIIYWFHLLQVLTYAHASF